MPNMTLAPDQVHLWFAIPETITDPHLIKAYHRFMNEKEVVKQARFHFERHRHQYLVTRALIRTTLSQYAAVRPEDWCFVENKYGRPALDPKHGQDLHFNLSHTDGLIACAVVRGREIGVDVENISRGGDLVGIADRFFSKQEVDDLHQVPTTRQEDRFFDYWTLKESYIKARGMGLSIPLGEFSFHISDVHQDIAISIDPKQQDLPERWQFHQWRYQENHKIALCVENAPSPQMEIVLRSIVPLMATKPFSGEKFRSSQQTKS